MGAEPPFLASVLVVTYNQEAYIRQAVDSVLSQKTDFAFEIIVGDDCSTDSTPEILRDYKRRYPDKIRLILNERNLGSSTNYMNLYNAASSKYVATVDGDDYWTSPDKLQKQIDLLEANPQCTMSAHRVECVDESGQPVGKVVPLYPTPAIVDFQFFLERNPVHMSAPVLRRSVLPELPASYASLAFGAGGHLGLMLQQGPMVFIDEIMSAYRLQDRGIWTKAGAAERGEGLIRTWEWLQARVKPEFRKPIDKPIARQCAILAYHFRKERQYKQSLHFALKAARKGLVGLGLLEIAKIPVCWLIEQRPFSVAAYPQVSK